MRNKFINVMYLEIGDQCPFVMREPASRETGCPPSDDVKMAFKNKRS